jgi:lipid-A-disaccharide synthase
MARVMVSCGEPSGDLYAGALARALREIDPATVVSGFGGEHLAAEGGRLVGDYRGISVTGLVEVVRLLPRTYAMYRRLVGAARDVRPDVFVAIDFPDFNFRLAAAMRRLGIPVVYYIGPQLWAWRPGRLQTMKRLANRVLVIFPFEVSIYEQAGVPVEFVGHPLVDLTPRLGPPAELRSALGLAADAPTVALLPGSRPNEVRLILPVLIDAARRLAATRPALQFVLARAPGLDEGLFEAARRARAAGLRLTAVEARTDAALAASDVVVTASGTATVQTALHGKPMVIVYRLSPVTYALGIRFVKVDTYGMVNLVAGRRIVPELIQDACTPEAVAAETARLLSDEAARAEVAAGLEEVRARLGGPGASRRAAEAVLRVARGAASA